MYVEASRRAELHGDRIFTTPARQDPYPSRLSAPPPKRLLPRHESLAQQISKNGPLTPTQCADFERDGFLFEESFLGADDIALFQQELDRLLSRDAFRGREFTITEPDSAAIRSLFAVHFLSTAFKKLAFDPRLLGRVEQLLGGQAYIHQSRINYKPGFVGKGFDWHSDFETWHAEDGMPAMRAISASIVLTDNTPFNGPLMLIPGSHQFFVPCVGETPEDNYRQSLKKQRIGTPPEEALRELIDRGGIQAPTGAAGSLLLFDCNTLHGSQPNMSPQPRSNVFFVYNRRDNLCTEPYGAAKPRPEFLAHRPDKNWTPIM
ncbi:ectoine hydroxylase [Spongiibacter sp. KMU-166]|uniref:Ectoine hydroxylase n=1 Tax=Spongiibacter thalassae TaxID=2721624 RepID=A0ABX1GFX9_9GAMM|nr:ectoine hydroxylase [Spongiibacter thalassae]NKI18051.1 ectoine hydroxylase [Spongiibacter thalassae]